MKNTYILFFTLFVASCSTTNQTHLKKNEDKRRGEYEVQLNQIGFFTKSPKTAIVKAKKNTDTHYVILNKDKKVVFEASAQPKKYWEASDEYFQIIDFSDFNETGEFYISSNDGAKSYSFNIKENLFANLSKKALKAFYLNRASIEIDEKHAGLWARKKGHPDDRVLIHSSAENKFRQEGHIISSTRGWYDAGDYNKYVINSSVATYVLLAAYQHCPSCFYDGFSNIPESGNKTPDILDEAEWNLEWLLSMQDPNDGGVYHKLTTLNFQGYIMPNEADATRYVVQKSTAATLDFVAVMAVAARIFEKFDKEKSSIYLRAALKAWKWAKNNPEKFYLQPKNVHTGTYADHRKKLEDEWLWAGVELTITTKKNDWIAAHELEKNASGGIPTWAYVTPLAWISTTLWSDHILRSDLKTISAQQIIRTANFLTDNTNAIGVTLGAYKEGDIDGSNDKDFEWGSNSFAAYHSIILLNAYQLTKQKDYLNSALSNLDYLLGRNPIGKSYVTGIGKNPPKNTHHRISIADGNDEPVPGWLVGGPHPGQQDADYCYPVKYSSKHPALSYLDDTCSWATNEVAINWNAALVYISSVLNNIYNDNNKM